MATKRQQARQEKIATAAYEVLAEKGYAGASMLAIARRAKSSNETLYRWYGDKTGLFAALVAVNAERVRGLLENSSQTDPLDALRALGPELYRLLTSERAIALNRAAAGDPTGELGEALGRIGRDTVAPMIGDLLVRLRDNGTIAFGTTAAAVSLYIDLLVGDHQIRRAIGTLPEPTEDAITVRAKSALNRFLALHAPSD